MDLNKLQSAESEGKYQLFTKVNTMRDDMSRKLFMSERIFKPVH